LQAIIESEDIRLIDRRDSFAAINVPLTPTKGVDPVRLKSNAFVCMRVFDELLAGQLQYLHDDDDDADSSNQSDDNNDSDKDSHSSSHSTAVTAENLKFGRSYTPPRSTISRMSPTAKPPHLS
jgi:hypothetical protein